MHAHVHCTPIIFKNLLVVVLNAEYQLDIPATKQYKKLEAPKKRWSYMVKLPSITDIEVKGKTVLLRVDFNSPLDENKKIKSNTRIKVHAETIKFLSDKGAKTVVLAHQGRPNSEDFTETLEAHTEELKRILGEDYSITHINDLYGETAKAAIKQMKEGDIVVLKNVRSNSEEMEKKTLEEHAQSNLVKNLAPLADMFVNDAFSAAHRGQASLVGFVPVLPSYFGPIMLREIENMLKAMKNTEGHNCYILGGIKPKESFDLMENVLSNNYADYVLLGGGVSHIFLKVKGYELGNETEEFMKNKGLFEFTTKAEVLLEKYSDKIVLPIDVAYKEEGTRKEIEVEKLPIETSILDIGSQSIEKFSDIIKKSHVVVMNGPMGKFEDPLFKKGTMEVLRAVSTVTESGFTLIGGGHTEAAWKELQVPISYVSIAGGAMLRFLSGKKMPAIEAILNKHNIKLF